MGSFTGSPPSNGSIYCGNFVHATRECPAVYVEDFALGVENGKVKFFEDVKKLDSLKEHFVDQLPQIYWMKDGEFLMPGLIDAHLHAPQFPNIGCGLDQPLIEWLNKYTFPTEAKFKENSFAEEIYRKVVRRTLKTGTTTASYFATIHLDSSLLLCDIIEQEGQRGYVGKVNMDQFSPDYYSEETSKSVAETEAFVQNVLKRKNPLLTPVITPRFALSCSSKLMQSLAEIGKKYNIPIQSHISENKIEIDMVTKEHRCNSYTDAYDCCSILGPKTYLAHGVHLTDDEIILLKSRETGVVHCPNSNISICSGLCDVRKLLNLGLKVGLGTDVAAGYSSSMFDAIRSAVQVSKILSFLNTNNPYQILTHEEAFCLATLGSSEVLGIQENVGNFEIGKDFDALLVDCNLPNSMVDFAAEDSLKSVFERFIYTGDDRNIKEVFVSGKSVVKNHCSDKMVNGSEKVKMMNGDEKV